MTKGVQQKDVWEAADALIGQGLRPTIERVRQTIGRGSPNTVSPMLEAWFATLASRLGVNSVQKQPNELPQALQENMENLWRLALSIGQEQAKQDVAQTRADFDEARQALGLRENELLQKHQIQLMEHAVLHESVRATKDKADDLLFRLNQVLLLASKRETEVESLRQKITLIEDEYVAERRRNSEAVSIQTQEREKYEKRVDATHHRLMQDIDRARQDAQKIRNEKQEIEKQFEAIQTTWKQKNESNENDLMKAQELLAMQANDIKSLQETLIDANLNLGELRNLLQKHQMGSEATIARLTEAFSSTTKRLAGKSISARKIRIASKKQ